jgi:tyrosyl-tRNA synthetase
MEYINIGISAFTAISILAVGLIMFNRNKALNELNLKMKSYLEIINIDEIKKYVDLRQESVMLAVDKITYEHGKEFAKDKEEIIKKLLENELKKTSEDFENKYNEVHVAVYNLLLTIPKNKRFEFINQHLTLTKEDFVKELKDYNELPNFENEN